MLADRYYEYPDSLSNDWGNGMACDVVLCDDDGIPSVVCGDGHVMHLKCYMEEASLTEVTTAPAECVVDHCESFIEDSSGILFNEDGHRDNEAEDEFIRWLFVNRTSASVFDDETSDGDFSDIDLSDSDDNYAGPAETEYGDFSSDVEEPYSDEEDGGDGAGIAELTEPEESHSSSDDLTYSFEGIWNRLQSPRFDESGLGGAESDSHDVYLDSFEEAEQEDIVEENEDMPPLECQVCGGDLSEDDFDSGGVARCRCRPGRYRHDSNDCNPPVRAGCKDCHSDFVQVGHWNELGTVTKQHQISDITSKLWDISKAVPQGNNANLCYAAAVATVSRCCGVNTSISECVHLFAISVSAVSHHWHKTYGEAYGRAVSSGATTVEAAHALISKHMPALYGQVYSSWGDAVFPSSVNAVAAWHMDWQGVKDALSSDSLIMLATDNHWKVAYGFRQSANGGKYLRIYDPMGGRVDEKCAWSQDDYESFYIITKSL